MANITRRPSGKYRVQIRKNGQLPLSKSFNNLKDAETWAKKIESDIDRGLFLDFRDAQSITVSKILSRFDKAIRPSKQIKSVLKILDSEFGQLTLIGLTSSVISKFRDRRFNSVCNETIRKDLSVLSRVINMAIKDWGINLPHGNPVSNVRMPKAQQGRDRRPTDDELTHLTTYPIVCFAIETAMRRSEIANMRWEHINWNYKTLYIPITKNKRPRTIPLTSKAIELLKAQPRHINGLVWNRQPDSITQLFQRSCKRHGIQDLRFHDLRHEATSRLFEKGLNPIEVASITGHTDTKMLMRYTHLRAEELVSKLD